MASRERTLVVLGAAGAGKATTIGAMLFKYGGIDMITMQRFEGEGIRTYDQATRNLRSLNIMPNFDTPKHHVVVSDSSTTETDCAILVLDATSLADATAAGLAKEVAGARGQAKELIVLVNKMDIIGWSAEQFDKVVKDLESESIPIIPFSALHGDNVVEKSSKCPWYRGWKSGNQEGTTLLEALEDALQA